MKIALGSDHRGYRHKNLLLDTLIASFLVSGSISWLYYSDRLLEFPVGILGVAIGTVILPNLSRNHTEKSPEQFSATLDWAVRLMVLLGIPATIGLLLLAGVLGGIKFLQINRMVAQGKQFAPPPATVSTATSASG